MGAPITIALLTTSYPRWDGDDAGIFVQRLVESLSGEGLVGSVIVPDDILPVDPSDLTSSTGNFKIVRFWYTTRKRRLAFGSGILPNLRTDPSLLLQLPLMLLGFLLKLRSFSRSTCVIHANWTITALPAALHSSVTGTPFIVTLRGDDVRLLSFAPIRFFVKRALRRASAIISVNESFVPLIESTVGEGGPPVICIPNGVEVVLPSEKESIDLLKEKGLPEESPLLLYIGRLIPLKNVEFLLSVMHRLGSSDAHLVLCGRATDELYQQRLKELCRELRIESRVRFMGQVSPHEIPLYLRAATIYLSASTREGRPNSVLEALAAGKIVLVSDIAPHREIISNRENGFLFTLSEPSECASLIKGIVTTTRASKGVGEGSFTFEELEAIKRRAQESSADYSWSKCAKSYHSVYQKALK